MKMYHVIIACSVTVLLIVLELPLGSCDSVIVQRPVSSGKHRLNTGYEKQHIKNKWRHLSGNTTKEEKWVKCCNLLGYGAVWSVCEQTFRRNASPQSNSGGCLGTWYMFVSCSVNCRPWRWRWYVPPKRWFTYRLHGAISQTMATFITTAARTANPTNEPKIICFHHSYFVFLHMFYCYFDSLPFYIFPPQIA
jgi:hypothetical protein